MEIEIDELIAVMHASVLIPKAQHGPSGGAINGCARMGLSWLRHCPPTWRAVAPMLGGHLDAVSIMGQKPIHGPILCFSAHFHPAVMRISSSAPFQGMPCPVPSNKATLRLCNVWRVGDRCSQPPCHCDGCEQSERADDDGASEPTLQDRPPVSHAIERIAVATGGQCARCDWKALRLSLALRSTEKVMGDRSLGPRMV